MVLSRSGVKFRPGRIRWQDAVLELRGGAQRDGAFLRTSTVLERWIGVSRQLFSVKVFSCYINVCAF